MTSEVLPTSSGFPAVLYSTSLPLPSPPPSPLDHDDEDEGDISDDESEHGKDDHHDEDHHELKRPPPAPPFLSAAASTIYSSSSISSSGTQTTLITSTSTLAISTTSTDALIPIKTGGSALNQSDSTPVNQADPSLEAKAGSSPLGTAGTVLAAVFALIALLTTLYLLFRLVRRRKACQSDRGGCHGRSNTFNSQTSIEKGLPTACPSTTQETGIIFGHRSENSNQVRNEQQVSGQARNRGHFSLLDRRWYSTGTEVTSSHAAGSEAPSTIRRWGAPLLELGLRMSRAASSRSDSTSALDERYAPGQADLQRNLSQSSTGSGHARAYAHHNVRPPRSVARSTISSISSRWLKRRSDSNESEAASETSDMHRTSTRHSTFRTKLSGEERKKSREVNQMPRLPLPVTLSSVARTMSI
ncbi:hypothetical protein LTR70_000744 [Exophiala xenobiotica]|uniref:Uncharacterized protein n=1 Tax=Lithohypha guttulata TaxID=1690604 RepID=A0ABR0KN99_9EURO|nr:hypothetical protein LTR24_000584 [Lithohypha guttulata]KAK5329247.1 hypothetical protein LTR70_000744 [Exophiala xenobiotica]